MLVNYKYWKKNAILFSPKNNRKVMGKDPKEFSAVDPTVEGSDSIN